MADPKSNPITIDELEAIAKQKLPSNVYDYYSSGSDDQKCLKRNRDAFDRYGILHNSTRTCPTNLL
jgi:isopentenyl diphosphate isomerase/L-lactate dehydrogenase-like FMN-dependent dehydrogenase